MALHLLQYSDVENAFDEPERVSRLAGGLVARRESLASAGEPVLVVGTGDVFAPGVLSLSTRGEHALSFFEAVEPVAETLGNHDFDHGVERARELVELAPHEFVVANAFEGEGAAADRLAAAETAPWTVVDAGACRVGLVGAASPDTGDMAPAAAEFDFRDPAEPVREALDEVRERGVDATVLLAHLGEPVGEELAASLDVDAVLDGHRHDPHVDAFDGTAYGRPGNGARHLVHAPVPLGAEEATAPTLVATATEPMHDELLSDVESLFAEAGLDEVVGTVEDPIDCGTAATDRGESRVGNLITDAYRWAAEADVAVMTSGGIRTRDSLSGPVTTADLIGLVPFEGELVTCEVDGETLRTVLERTTMHHLHEVHRKFGHVSGATLVWDDAAAEFRAVRVDGDHLDPDATYRVATSEYFVVTDHLIQELGDERVVERHGVQYDAIVEYARTVGVDPRVEGRIRRPTKPADWPPTGE